MTEDWNTGVLFNSIFLADINLLYGFHFNYLNAYLKERQLESISYSPIKIEIFLRKYIFILAIWDGDKKKCITANKNKNLQKSIFCTYVIQRDVYHDMTVLVIKPFHWLRNYVLGQFYIFHKNSRVIPAVIRFRWSVFVINDYVITDADQ